MPSLIDSIEGMVGASVKGLMDFAEGYIGESKSESSGGRDGLTEASGVRSDAKGDEKTLVMEGVDVEGSLSPNQEEGIAENDTNGMVIPVTNPSLPPSKPTPIPRTTGLTSTSTSLSTDQATHMTSQPISISNSAPMPKSNPTQTLITTTDVPSGWIHLQSTYLDESGSQRKTKWFGITNLVDQLVEVEVGSDLGNQLCFWVGEDERSEFGFVCKTTSCYIRGMADSRPSWTRGPELTSQQPHCPQQHRLRLPCQTHQDLQHCISLYSLYRKTLSISRSNL